jgi:hypothetical protein
MVCQSTPQQSVFMLNFISGDDLIKNSWADHRVLIHTLLTIGSPCVKITRCLALLVLYLALRAFSIKKDERPQCGPHCLRSLSSDAPGR